MFIDFVLQNINNAFLQVVFLFTCFERKNGVVILDSSHSELYIQCHKFKSSTQSRLNRHTK